MLSSKQLFERACSSLDLGCLLLTAAAADLSASSTFMLKSTSRLKRKRKKRRAAAAPPTISPYFALATTSKPKSTPRASPYFTDPFIRIPTPPGLPFELLPTSFGLIQERICASLYALVLQAILWNKTKGTAARPILWSLLRRYPTPASLAEASHVEVEDMIRILGLQRRRAQRLIDMAKMWILSPPSPERRYGRRNYPKSGSNRLVKEGELLGPDDVREGWEIGHLPGVGEYALDSYRIFGRDRLRSLHNNPAVEPEWKRLVPRDKELGPYVRSKWAQEGWKYDLVTGKRTRLPP